MKFISDLSLLFLLKQNNGWQKLHTNNAKAAFMATQTSSNSKTEDKEIIGMDYANEKTREYECALRPPLKHNDSTEDEWLTTTSLSVVVVGASGDLAKKMTYPALFSLFDSELLPQTTQIWGFARSEMTDSELRDKLRPALKEKGRSEEAVEKFLECCFYHRGEAYDDKNALEDLKTKMQEFENEDTSDKIKSNNRLFYLAVPPDAFSDIAIALKKTCMQDESKGFTRLIVEKPFGRDSETYEKLSKTLCKHFKEDNLFRIDHLLGTEMVQNLAVLRFSNVWFERVWNRDNIKCVMITFKESFGAEGRGGYFDSYGIIRDMHQNHLLQVLTLVAMETPRILNGPGEGEAIRDAKLAVLRSIAPITVDDIVIGQYEGYADDDSIENKESITPTFATIHLRVNTPRWHGVPFIMKAGKALDEDKSEIRIQLKDAPSSLSLFGQECPRNELVIAMKPKEAIYMKTNVKSPGFSTTPVQSELKIEYDAHLSSKDKKCNPDAYTRLILGVIKGDSATFVRDDELKRAWEIFTPILHKIEDEKIQPIIYKKGTRGPRESDDLIYRKAGYSRNDKNAFINESNDEEATNGDAVNK